MVTILGICPGCGARLRECEACGWNSEKVSLEVRCVCCDKPSGFVQDSSGEHWCRECPDDCAPTKTPVQENT